LAANFLFIEGLPPDFFNPRSNICFIAILQGVIFAALLVFRYFKHQKTADFCLAALLQQAGNQRRQLFLSLSAEQLG